jgi:primary-amine oxidase
MTNPIAAAMPHPLQPLSDQEILEARKILFQKHGEDTLLFFRSVYLEEPLRAEVVRFLTAEHDGYQAAKASLEVTLPRLVKCLYDVIRSPEEHQLSDAVVDLRSGEIVQHIEHPSHCQSSFTM